MLLMGKFASQGHSEPRLQNSCGPALLYVLPGSSQLQRAMGETREWRYICSFSLLAQTWCPCLRLIAHWQRWGTCPLLDADVLTSVAPLPGQLLPSNSPLLGRELGQESLVDPGCLPPRSVSPKSTSLWTCFLVASFSLWNVSKGGCLVFIFWFGLLGREGEKQSFGFEVHASNSYVPRKHWFRRSKLDLGRSISSELLTWKKYSLALVLIYALKELPN